MPPLALDKLTEAERRVWRAAETGAEVTFQVASPEADRPSGGHAWGAEREVRAAILYQLLVGAGDGTPPIHARGVHLQGAKIIGDPNFEAATLRRPMTLLDCYLDQTITLTGASARSVRLSGCHLPGLLARELVVQGDLQLDAGFTATGEVRLTGAKIGGDLNCRDGRFANPTGLAIDGYALSVAQTMFCCDGFRSDGEVRLEGAHFGGALLCSGGAFSSRSAPALRADLISVDQGVLLNDGFTAQGEVRLTGAHIHGQLVLSGGHFANELGPAINGDGIDAERGIICAAGFHASGGVRLVGARIGSELNCSGGSFATGEGSALDLTRALLDGSLVLRPDNFEGRLDLTHARIGCYYDDSRTWPQELFVDGLVYDSIEAKPDITAVDRLRWLELNNGGVYASQPYEQLAGFYRRQGLDAGARIVAITKQRRRRAVANPVAKAGGHLLDWTIGYGYRTWLAIPWLIVLVTLASVIFAAAYPDHMTSVRKDGQPPFQAVTYALDVLLPVVSLHQRDAWSPEGIFHTFFVAFTLAGWVLASAVGLSLTGLLRRD